MKLSLIFSNFPAVIYSSYWHEDALVRPSRSTPKSKIDNEQFGVNSDSTWWWYYGYIGLLTRGVWNVQAGPLEVEVFGQKISIFPAITLIFSPLVGDKGTFMGLTDWNFMG